MVSGWRQRTLATAPLLALYQTKPGLGLVAPTLAMLMMDPPCFCSRSFFTTADVPRNTLFTLTFMTISNSFSVTSSVGLFLYEVPALFTSISSRPYLEMVPDTRLSQSGTEVTSAWTNEIWEGLVAATRSPPFTLMSEMTTLAPSDANR